MDLGLLFGLDHQLQLLAPRLAFPDEVLLRFDEVVVVVDDAVIVADIVSAVVTAVVIDVGVDGVIVRVWRGRGR